MSRAFLYVLAVFLFIGAAAIVFQVPSAPAQTASVALFGDSLSYGMDRFAPGVLQGTRFTLSGTGNSFVASNGGKSTTHFFNAARNAMTNPSFSVIDFSLGGNNPSTAGAHYQQLASLAVQNHKTLMLPVYNHVGGGFDTRASDAAARELAAKHPGTVKLIDYSKVPCFRARNGGDPHVGAACYRQMAAYRQSILEGAANSSCLKKTDITVGFRGLPDRCGSPGNSSDGVDAAVNNAGGKVFEHNQQTQALQYIQSQLSNKSDATITIVGHSAGANTAIRVAAELASKDIKVTRVVAADPSSGSAGRIPNNIVQAVGLISNSPSYSGIKISGASPTINLQRNVGHCEIDNLIEKAIPCVKCDGNKCEYTGSSICTTDASGKETCTTNPNLHTTNTPTPQTTPQSLPQRLQSLMQNLRGSQQQPSGNNNSSRGNTNNTRSSINQCPTGYTQTTEEGRIVCTKKSDSTTNPQCVLVGSRDSVHSGEQLILRWRTTGSARVDITNVGENISVNGQRTVTPDKDTIYTLTATNNEGEKGTCEFSVTVSDEQDNSLGRLPPKLSCSPPLIKRGASSLVTWECPPQADSSKGVGFTTSGKKEGSIKIEPEHNTEYTVACIRDDEEIGIDSCSVSVGDPQFDVVAHPQRAGKGDRVRIGWASLFMESCRVVGPRGFDFQRPQGVVITEPFAASSFAVSNQTIRAAVYTLSCTSVFGDQVSRDIEVQFRQ